jgi:hypothetical protein
MADNPPYMNAYGNVTKILNKIKEAKTPDRFSQDYLDTVLGFSGGGARPFISLGKRIGLLNADGTPSDLYHRFRNPAQSEQAAAEMIKKGYPSLFRRNEYAHRLNKADLTGLLMEITGLDSTSPTLNSMVNTFEALKGFANFELEGLADGQGAREGTVMNGAAEQPAPSLPGGRSETAALPIKFSHNIYINLPDTTDMNVFNAIFRSMKEHLFS